MCDSCGCAFTDVKFSARGAGHDLPLPDAPAYAVRDHLPVVRHLLAQNDHVAEHNRAHFDAHGVLTVNLMSSPGAGKTTLLEHTIRTLGGRYRIAVIEGDLATENDARRIRALGVPAIQITTGSACHLDASMVHGALHELELSEVDLLFIENVGNLVCPASFDLGAHLSVALLSVPEGDDKPEKYPVMFRRIDLVLLTKSDLLAHLPEFDMQRARASLRAVGCAAETFETSRRDDASLDAWREWLTRKLSERRMPRPQYATQPERSNP